MRLNVFRQELRMGRRSFWGWLAALVLLSGFFAWMYPVVAKDFDAFLSILDHFPKEFALAFGVDLMRFGTILGFFAFLFTFVLLAASIQALGLGLSVLSAEVRDKTADFLYAKPVSRSRILGQKILAVFVQIIAANLVYLASTYAVLLAVNAYATPNKALPADTYLLLGLSMFLLQSVFAAIGFFLSSFLRRVRTVLPISMGVVFFFYFLNMLKDALEIEEMAYLTPFAYFNLSTALVEGAYETRFLFLAATLVIGLTALAWTIYSRKDMPAI
ncbi:MAG: ABC transporter permease subunit [Clostridia bacterium]|nr:ABC transporter permease subunit [Clostridia bacterium]